MLHLIGFKAQKWSGLNYFHLSDFSVLTFALQTCAYTTYIFAERQFAHICSEQKMCRCLQSIWEMFASVQPSNICRLPTPLYFGRVDSQNVAHFFFFGAETFLGVSSRQKYCCVWTSICIFRGQFWRENITLLLPLPFLARNKLENWNFKLWATLELHWYWAMPISGDH